MLREDLLAKVKLITARGLRGEATPEETAVMARAGREAWRACLCKGAFTPFTYSVWYYAALYAELFKAEVGESPEDLATVVSAVAKWLSRNTHLLCDPELVYSAAEDVVNGLSKILPALSSASETLPDVERLAAEVEELRREVEAYRQESERDPLTGLLNRRGLDRRLAHLVEVARQTGVPLSVVFLDVDHFKKVNDTYGHEAGDVVLEAVARAVAGCVRSVDVVGRYGGEEFVVALRGLTEDEAVAVAERIRKTVADRRVVHAGRVISVTVSAGVAQYEDGASVAELLATADRRLYLAKRSGRNAVVGSAVEAKLKEAEAQSVAVDGTDVERLTHRPKQAKRQDRRPGL